MNIVKSFFLAMLTLVMFTACNNESSVQDEARQNLTENNVQNAVTPNANADAANAKTPAEPVVPAGPTTSLSFATSEFDFGSVDQGEIVEHEYKFTNTGSEPLIISNAKGSCGCTVPDWPKDPIAPGAEGSIKVRFDSKGKKNKQNKKVTITANTEPAQTFIYMKGEVIAPETPATPTQK